ncbi:hypothetical protein GCM10010123_06340 [Pilimelia anulata]|uniref:Uncharacterized protein n=1 Tax=Pilimelia anulata TaxID=53371 RepID=A0A8J3B6X3_9ACTN|nr:hypothetical protein [Pilimelia anulata]GGJ79137.1 hypothetical protein GCM10010123_06340 [Pilimelia anulata]
MRRLFLLTAAVSAALMIVPAPGVAARPTQSDAGTFVVRARDARTGKPVEGFCTEVRALDESRADCTKGTATSVTLTDVPTDEPLTVVTTQNLKEYPQRYYIPAQNSVRPGMPREYTSVFELGGIISTSVKRRATGTAVAKPGVELRPLFDPHAKHVVVSLAADDAGLAVSEPVPAGRYNLFAYAEDLGA